MKSSEKQLRLALSEIAHATHGLPCDGAPDAILVRIRAIAMDALAASETTDLDRLVEWLKDHRLVGMEVDAYAEGQSSFVEYQLNYIADEFGVGGDDES